MRANLHFTGIILGELGSKIAPKHANTSASHILHTLSYITNSVNCANSGDNTDSAAYLDSGNSAAYVNNGDSAAYVNSSNSAVYINSGNSTSCVNSGDSAAYINSSDSAAIGIMNQKKKNKGKQANGKVTMCFSSRIFSLTSGPPLVYINLGVSLFFSFTLCTESKFQSTLKFFLSTHDFVRGYTVAMHVNSM